MCTRVGIDKPRHTGNIRLAKDFCSACQINSITVFFFFFPLRRFFFVWTKTSPWKLKKEKCILSAEILTKAAHLAVFFIEHFAKYVCLICPETIAVKKVSNIKQYCETRHNHYNNFTGKTREDEAAWPRKDLKSFLTWKVEINNRNTRASYEASKLTAERITPFSYGEFFKKCMLRVEKRELFFCKRLIGQNTNKANWRSDSKCQKWLGGNF